VYRNSLKCAGRAELSTCTSVQKWFQDGESCLHDTAAYSTPLHTVTSKFQTICLALLLTCAHSLRTHRAKFRFKLHSPVGNVATPIEIEAGTRRKRPHALTESSNGSRRVGFTSHKLWCEKHNAATMNQASLACPPRHAQTSQGQTDGLSRRTCE